MRIAIRCDADSGTGTGHVMRCFALAEELAAGGHSITWISRISGVPWLNQVIRDSGWDHIEAPWDESELAPLVNSLRPDWLIVDSYKLNPDSFTPLLPQQRVAAIEDDTSPRYEADLYISPGINADWQVAPVGKELLAGPDYVLIRSELRRRRSTAAPANRSKSGRLVAVLGGTDAAGIGPCLADLARRGKLPAPLELISAHPRLAEGSPTPATPARPSLIAYRPSPDAWELLLNAQLVISSAGVTSWELLCVGIPAALIQAVDNQLPNYQEMTQRGWAAGLGLAEQIKTDPDGFADRIAAIWADSRALNERAVRAWQAVDGKGAERIRARLEHWEDCGGCGDSGFRLGRLAAG